MFSHLKIGIRLSLIFAVMLAMLLAIAVIAIKRNGDLQEQIRELVNDKAVKAKIANDIIDETNAIGRYHREMLILRSDANTREQIENALVMRKKITENYVALEKMSFVDKEKQALDSLRDERQKVIAVISQFEELIKTRQWEEAVRYFDSTYRQTLDHYMQSIDTFLARQNEMVDAVGKDADALAASSRNLIMGVAALAMVIGLLLAFMMTRSITRPIGQMVDASNKMALGNFNFKLAVDGRDETGQLAAGMTAIQSSVQRMIADAEMLVKAAAEGKLAARADAEKHQGDFQKVVKGVNETLDAVIGPLNVAATYVDRIAKGDIPAKITDNYNGDFNTIKNNLNSLIDTLNGFEAAQKKIWEEHAAGAIDYVIPTQQFDGVYARIADGINKLVASHIAVKMRVVEVVKQYAEGDFSADMDRLPGKKAQITQAIDDVKSNLQSIQREIAHLVEAAVQGRLATRADAGKFKYDFKAMVQGINDTLDAVIGPLNVAANYVDRISKGDIPAKITDNYNGDFNTIKNNLNSLIDTLNGFEAAQKKIWEEHAAGAIDYVIPTQQFDGVYARIADGINKLVASHIAVKMRVVEVVKQYAEGDFSADMDRLPGKKAQITQAIDDVKSNLQSIQREIAHLVEAAVQGRLATRADAGKFKYDFKAMVQGINDTLDAVIGPLNVAANYVDRISKGDIPAKITDNYNGDFNTIKNNLNTCIDAVNALVTDAAMLSRAAVEGKLATRADASKHQGDFQRVVKGVNDTLDAVIGPLN
ncbi:MAG TPA: HAMP domain-containing protein, partial [Accumulibacter sp.]|nr:HAMP domain-containing protein [Accumulibacter sp.]